MRSPPPSSFQGAAFGAGFCAASHLDTVVAKLEAVTKEDMVRKSKGFFGFSKDKSEADVENIKATVMLCYGYVTFHSPPQWVLYLYTLWYSEPV